MSITTEIYKDHKIKIDYDEISDSPLEWDDTIKWTLHHKKYNLKEDLDINTDDFNWWEDMDIKLAEEYQAVVPVSMHEHSAVSYHAGYKSGRDSGVIGFAVSNEYTQEELWDRVVSVLEAYTQWANWWVYYISIEGNHFEDCYGSVYGDFEDEIDRVKEDIDKAMQDLTAYTVTHKQEVKSIVYAKNEIEATKKLGLDKKNIVSVSKE